MDYTAAALIGFIFGYWVIGPLLAIVVLRLLQPKPKKDGWGNTYY